MTTFAVSMVKDEADVIAGSVRHMADEVDHLIVADNGSTDGTRDLLADLAKDLPLTVFDDPDPAYYQSAKMSFLAAQAAEQGAKWIVPFDADELWISSHGRIADVLADPAVPRLVVAALFDHYCTAIDPADPDPFRRTEWRRAEPAPLPKVAFLWSEGAVVHQGNHGVTLPDADYPFQATGLIEIRHFPYRSAEQFISKARNGAAAYKATNLPEDQGAHWRAYGAILEQHGEEALGDVFRQHFWHLSPTDAGLVRDPAPYLRWQ